MTLQAPLIPLPSPSPSSSSSSPMRSTSSTPAPPASSSPPLGTPSSREDLESIYAPLFEPATPRGSRTGSPVPPLFPVTTTTAPSVAPPKSKISRAPSTDDDFGAFVEVKYGEDPLSSIGDSSWPAAAKENANDKGKAKETQRELVKEVLDHEDDPMWFVKDPPPTTETLNGEVPEKEEKEEKEVEVAEKDWLAHSLSDLDTHFFTPRPALALVDRVSVERVPTKHTSLPASTSHSRFSSTISHEQSLSRPSTPKPTPTTSIFPSLPAPHLTNIHPTTTPILTASMAALLRPSLPALPRLSKNWALLYSTDQHGTSLATLYGLSAAAAAKTNKFGSGGEFGAGGGPGEGARGEMPMMLVIQDTEGNIFGAFVVEGIKKEPRYYGSGDAFLWRKEPGEEDQVKVWKYTCANTYTTLNTTAFMSFGGGGNYYGLWVDKDLAAGSSSGCATFGNEALCFDPDEGGDREKNRSFEVLAVEVWGIRS